MIRIVTSRLMVIGLILGYASLASATTYYVSPSGSDTDSGSSNQPFKTIQKGADVVNPGDTVIVRDGVYTNAISNCGLLIQRGGTSNNWVTFRSENKWGAVIDGQTNTTSYGVSPDGVAYVRIKDFEIKGFVCGGVWVTGRDNVNANNIYIQGNLIHDIGRGYTDTAYGQVGVWMDSSTTNCTIDGNVVHTIGRLPHDPLLPYDQNHDHGFYLCGNQTKIINNILYNNKAGWCMQIVSYEDSSGWLIANNTCSGANPYRDGQIILWYGGMPLTDVVIENNIFNDPRYGGVISGDPTYISQVTICNNMSSPGTTILCDPTFPCTLTNNLEGVDPEFMDAANHDFRLMPGSPAIDVGITVAGLTNDYDGVLRPQGDGYDMGAYEFHGVPFAPTGVTASDGTYTDKVRITWCVSSGASGYEVWRNSSESTNTATRVGNTTGITYDDTPDAAETMYYYWIKATNIYGSSSFSSSDSGYWRSPMPGEVAFGVAAYSVNESAGSVTLTVTRSGLWCDGAASVNYATQNGTALAGVDYTAVSGTLSWSDGDSASKTITVTVINRFGKQDNRAFTVALSGASGATLSSPSSATVTIEDIWPSVPSGVIASKGAYSDKVLVYWTAVSYATSYKVWRGITTNAQNASLIGTSTVSLYLDTTTTPDLVYYYWIQAVNEAGTSDLSASDSGYCGSIINLTSPTGLQASDGSYTDRIWITWQAVNSATRYEVWRNTGNIHSAASLISEPTETNYNDLSVAQGIYYYYWIRARNANNSSDYSGQDTGWCRLSAPDGVSASNGSYPYHIRVVWNAVANATWYEVWREEVPGSNSDGVNLIKVAQTGEVYFNDYYTKSGVYYRYKVKACNDLTSSLDYGHNTGYRQVNAATTLLSAINDYDGDKLSDLALFNPLSGVLDVLCSALGRQTFVLGAEHSQGVTGDYDGDRMADPVAYYPDSGTWLARLSSTGYNPIIRVSFGGNGNDPVAADFDGDGLTDGGIYNETDGVLSVILSNGGAFDIRASCLIGGPGYRFVSADFDGDAKADPAVYSESDGRVVVMFSGNEYSSASVALGGPGKAMFAADFDGDAKADPVLYEPFDSAGSTPLTTGQGRLSTGLWIALLSSAGYSEARISFGGPGYVPAIGDYDGDAKADPAIYQPAAGQWLIMLSASSYAVITETFGGPEYQPVMK